MAIPSLNPLLSLMLNWKHLPQICPDLAQGESYRIYTVESLTSPEKSIQVFSD